MPYIVYALPRSRTYWLSHFLSYGDWHCGHDELRTMRSLDDVRAWLSQPNTGTVETSAAPWWRLAADVPAVVIRRPVEDVLESLMHVGIRFDVDRLTAAMHKLDRKLDQIERRLPNVLSVQYADLASETTCARIFEHCLPYRHDALWWKRLSPLNLQINWLALVRYQQVYERALIKLGAIAKQAILAGMARRPAAIEGVTFQQEPFETFYRDGQHLFAEHLCQVGEAPTAFAAKNLPLMRKLEEIDCLQITTARSNGRMFGYLMAVISPSLESPDTMIATHTTFYVSPAAAGIGLKLQRASVSALRERNVNEVLLRAGPRGSGPRMGALYRRMGATDGGQLYSLAMGTD